MAYMSRDGLVEVRTNISSLFESLKRLSVGPALAGNVSSYSLNKYTKLYGGTLCHRILVRHLLPITTMP